MAQLTEGTGLNDHVHSTKFEFGKRSATDVIRFEFDWLAPESAIQYIQSGCPSCTKVWYENGKIVGDLDLSKIGGLVPGVNGVTKTATVWLNDGQPRYIAGDKKQQVQNPLKRSIVLTIFGSVVI